MSGSEVRLVAKRIAVVLLMLALVLGAGCAAGDDEAEDVPGNGAADDEPGAQVTLGTLPTEPGTAWDVAWYLGDAPLPIDMQVAGPWTFPSAQDWQITTTQIVDPADVPEIEQFSGYDFVVKSDEFGEELYYPRQITDEWMLQLGRIPAADPASAEPYSEPLKLWPVTFEVGDTFVVLEGENFRVDAEILAQNTATVPAGEIEDAYLVRFKYTPITEGAIEGTNYYILAPDIGFVALFSVSEGDEATGFKALDSASVLATLPAKR